ncbi:MULTISPECIES: hypothetical protein [Mannheimia]|uniref:Uncharacterized protein n=1 Tax=Mannheimia pernigra TaxID=111844 RepID=A0A7D5E1K4_9PAST|nr:MULTISPECIES: hypothetical protein [Mannheimia]QLB39768.1 hypothetical protein HV559_02120 [Mannheimia pernigra]QLB41738.1 hypothetical protein HV560_02245 [Mannheimia pernigra]QTM01029.1 hypothetical protein GM698_05150 [Mannheimia sp. ZY171111]
MFGSNRDTQSRFVAQNRPFTPYTSSEIEALIAGYVEVADDRAYNGRCFVKAGKKWIHNLNALRKKLSDAYGRYIDDEELEAGYPEGFGYDVANYYSRHNRMTLAENKEFQKLMQAVKLH